MSNNNLSWYKVMGTGAVTVILTVGGVGLLNLNDNGLSEADVERAVESAHKGELDNKVIKLNSDVDRDVKDIKVKIFEDDVWEAESQVMAEEELEEDDYEELREWILDEFSGDFKSFYDAEDIEDFRVVIRDVDHSGMDVDDRDATVEHELKVYYEDKNGDNVKRYVTVTTEIEDNDVDDQDFEETR